MRQIWILLLLPLLLLAQTPLGDRQIQAKLNVLNGAAAECVMHRLYTGTGWVQIEGEVGRNGIDGLYYKEKKGRITEVLVAESKWNTSRLGRSGRGKLVKQMSKEWVLRTLHKLQQKYPMPEYSRIEALVSAGQYRARLFRLKPKGSDALEITIYKIRNKGDRSFDTFLESRLRPIVLNAQRNPFEVMITRAYNSCRKAGLHRYFPSLPESAIETLLQDNYLKAKEVRPYL